MNFAIIQKFEEDFFVRIVNESGRLRLQGLGEREYTLMMRK